MGSGKKPPDFFAPLDFGHWSATADCQTCPHLQFFAVPGQQYFSRRGHPVMNVEEVKQSFGRCCLVPNFFDRFYEIFLKSHPNIPPMFANTDFDKQKKLLRAGVNMVLMFAEGSQMAKMTVDRIRKSHGKDAMNIDANLYPYWVDSLLKAVKECDPNMNAQLEREWREVLNPAIQHIAAGYQRSAS